MTKYRSNWNTTQLTLLLSAIIAGMYLMGCGQPAPAGDVTPEAASPLPPTHLTRTAEAAAVLTIEAALSAEGPTPEATEAAQPVNLEAAARALAQLYGTRTAQAIPTATRPPTATPRPPTPVVIVVTATPEPATNTPIPPPTLVPPTPTLTRDEREAQVVRRLRLRQGNGDPIFAYRTEEPPTVDGHLGEWRDKSYRVQNPVFKPEDWQGWRDLSGVFFIAWDVGNLYVGVEVTDDAHVQNESGRTMYRGDDVEIQLDAQLQADFAEDKLSEDDNQIGLSPGSFADRPPEAYVWLPSERDGTMIDLAARQTANGYVLEAAIPWWVLGAQPQPETAYGFALSLSDNDTPGTSTQECMISTSPNRTTYSNPTLLGNLILMDLQ